MAKINEIFGNMVFNDDVMVEKLPKSIYKTLKKTIEEGKLLDPTVANAVAHAMKEWAIEKGCTHYSHWFQPMTGITAEKHDSFLNKDANGKVIMEFSGKRLIKGEPDASSFPSGGIRATFEARGYTTWDPTSYAFIKDNTLYIPSAFCSYTGQILDKKTPLLRSMQRVSTEAVRILHLFGKTEVSRVTTTVGAEQEYFLIDKKVFEKRKDLMYTGRTLLGAKSPKGQELEDHYFGSINSRVSAYMKDLDKELWKLGILSVTKHNEVAPAQHEMAPLYTTSNIAVDQNQLTMTIMKEVAKRHGLVCLLHEKPFKGINGSGKHNNWSISTNTGENLLKPGKKPYENIQFLLFLAATVKAVDEHQDLLRLSVATAGNDHRLGANEAPPAIISMYLGSEFEGIINSIINGENYLDPGRTKMGMGVEVLPDFKKDTTDRNRTSPFAFTGDKFEFRMLGSSLNISCPNIMLNTIFADSLKEFADKLEKEDNFNDSVKELIKETFKKHKRIIFNGNNYSNEWVEEAEKRGLLNLKDAPEALAHYISNKNIKLFERNNIYTESEVTARYEIVLQNYSKILNIEALTMLEMCKRDILPKVSEYTKLLADTALSKQNLSSSIPVDTEIELVEELSKLLKQFTKRIALLESALINAEEYSDTSLNLAKYYGSTVFTAMESLRAVTDKIELKTGSEYWPFPTYGDILFSV